MGREVSRVFHLFFGLALCVSGWLWMGQITVYAQESIDICEAIDTSGSIKDSQLAI